MSSDPLLAQCKPFDLAIDYRCSWDELLRRSGLQIPPNQDDEPLFDHARHPLVVEKKRLVKPEFVIASFYRPMSRAEIATDFAKHRLLLPKIEHSFALAEQRARVLDQNPVVVLIPSQCVAHGHELVVYLWAENGEKRIRLLVAPDFYKPTFRFLAMVEPRSWWRR